MLLNYLRLTIRTFLKNKVAFFINLIGMSIALGCCITACVNYQYNTKFDTQQKNAANIYRIGFWQSTEKKQVPYGVCPMPVGNLISESMKDDEAVVKYISKRGQFRIGDEIFEREFVYTQQDFTKVFSIELLSGSLSLTTKAKFSSATNWLSIILDHPMWSENHSRKLFQVSFANMRLVACTKLFSPTHRSGLMCLHPTKTILPILNKNQK
jgi:hypothetical protein